MDATFVEREQERLLAELSDFLAIPSISALPDHAPDCRKAAEWLMAEFKRLGFPVIELLEGEGHPIVWAESPRVEGKPTILIYGHYDVQPVDPVEEWVSPPFQATVRDGRLYARGAVDDKGQVFTLLKAYEATRGEDGLPPVNLRFLIEGEEESGGEMIDALLTREPERTEADAVVVADMGYYAPGLPAVYTALRGICYAEIHCRTLERDLHSGSYGGVAPNAIETIVRILAGLKDESGEINVPRIYKTVEPPTKSELKTWKKLPFDRKTFLTQEVTGKALTGLEEHSILERIWALPTLEMHGIRGGFTGEGAKTVIPAYAVAKVSLRLVPGNTYQGALAGLTKAVKRLTPDYAAVEVRPVHGSDPVQVDVDDPAFGVLDQAFEEVVGRKTVTVRAGGSIPIVAKLGLRGAPVLLTGIGLPDDGLHSPNEKVDVQQIWDGVKVFGRFFELFGGKESGNGAG
jgi:acetylornithine deacetylase/succinyl-diaminopimelate desuccinylase-like protein